MSLNLKRLLALGLALILTVGTVGTVIPRAGAEEMKTAIGTVTTDSLRFRSGPSLSSPIIGTAWRNDKLVVIRREGDWYRVIFNLQTGYVHRDYVKLEDPKNIKLGYARFYSTTNIRSKPSIGAGIVTKAYGGNTCFIVGFNQGWYKISYNGTPGYVRSDLVKLLELPYENRGSQGNTYRVANARMSRQEKLKLIFGNSGIADPRLVYKTEAEAKSHMVNIAVRTWDLNRYGNKYTRSWALTVHEKLAPTVEALFEDLYALSERPVIHSMGGFRWAGKSEHSVGLAIDMNPEENYYCNQYGRILVGYYFRPYSDPYSFPVGGSVDRIFAKYGFTRGIYWKNGYKDYMHYSFFGT